VIRHIVTSLYRIYASTTPVRPGLQRFNPLRRRSRSSFRAEGAITIIEMLVVIMVIFILAALVLAASSYVQNKGARARAETEIAAISAALESYKADNGIYPRDATNTDSVNPATSPVPTTASKYLYEQLSGDTNDDRIPEAKSYFTFLPNMLAPAAPLTGNVTAIRDPFGNPYGYSTAKAAGQAYGNNPTYDLWSTAGDTTSNPTKWIKNW
jgi:type II secretory pathway pseudopilin PulG